MTDFLDEQKIGQAIVAFLKEQSREGKFFTMGELWRSELDLTGLTGPEDLRRITRRLERRGQIASYSIAEHSRRVYGSPDGIRKLREAIKEVEDGL